MCVLNYLSAWRYIWEKLASHKCVATPRLKNTDLDCQDRDSPWPFFVLQASSMFDPTSYRSVHNLATNTDKRPFEDLIKKTAEAIFMAKVS